MSEPTRIGRGSKVCEAGLLLVLAKRGTPLASSHVPYHVPPIADAGR